MASRLARVGNTIIDLGTANKSFLELARDLKRLGIKNWYFMLEVKDPSIIKIDPYQSDANGNTTLSKDQIVRVLNECTANPWYYLREISRIPDQGGSPIPYKANRGNIAQAWCFLHNLDSWLNLPRRKSCCRV